MRKTHRYQGIHHREKYLLRVMGNLLVSESCTCCGYGAVNLIRLSEPERNRDCPHEMTCFQCMQHAGSIEIPQSLRNLLAACQFSFGNVIKREFPCKSTYKVSFDLGKITGDQRVPGRAPPRPLKKLVVGASKCADPEDQCKLPPPSRIVGGAWTLRVTFPCWVSKADIATRHVAEMWSRDHF